MSKIKPEYDDCKVVASHNDYAYPYTIGNIDGEACFWFYYDEGAMKEPTDEDELLRIPYPKKKFFKTSESLASGMGSEVRFLEKLLNETTIDDDGNKWEIYDDDGTQTTYWKKFEKV